MQIKVEAKNFQALTRASLTFETGISVISGRNNSGKTALFRALKAFYFNSAGAAQVRDGASGLSVSVSHTDDEIGYNSAEISRTATGTNSYLVNGKRLDKVGRNSIPDVERLFRVREVEVSTADVSLFPNFWFQDEQPFLLNLSPAKIYDFFSQEPQLLEALEDLKEQAKESNKAIKSSETSIATLVPLLDESKKRFDALKGLDPVMEEVINLQLLYDEAYLPVSGLIDRLSNSLKQVDESEQQLYRIDDALNSVEDLSLFDRYFDLYAKVDVLGKLYSDSDKLSKALVRIDQVLELDFTFDFEVIKNLKTKIKLLEETQDSYNSSVNGYTKLCEELSVVVDELDSFEICPLCNQSLRGDNHV